MKRIIAAVTLFIAQSVFAHPGHDVTAGMTAGLMHPLTGIDHLIALSSVGVLLAFTSTGARWAGFATLLTSLAIGASIGLSGVVLPGSEWLIALSVLAAGFMLVHSYRSGRVRSGPLIAGTAVFALVHGYAHGVEVTGAAGAFVPGFLAMSLAVVAIAMLCAKSASRIVAARRAKSSQFLL